MDTHYDPRGVIAESFRIEGISAPECRSIFLDWALEPKGTAALKAAATALNALYAPRYPDHPMTLILQDAMRAPMPTPKRRGGRRARA